MTGNEKQRKSECYDVFPPKHELSTKTKKTFEKIAPQPVRDIQKLCLIMLLNEF